MQKTHGWDGLSVVCLCAFRYASATQTTPSPPLSRALHVYLDAMIFMQCMQNALACNLKRICRAYRGVIDLQGVNSPHIHCCSGFTQNINKAAEHVTRRSIRPLKSAGWDGLHCALLRFGRPCARRYSKTMIKLISVFIVFFSVSVLAEDKLSKSLGLIILENDRLVELQSGYRHQVPDIFNLIESEYDENIKNLETANRVVFYKSLTLHLNLSDHEVLDLAKLIKHCCAKEYISMANSEAKKYKEGISLSYKAKRLATVAKLLTYNKL
jgi:hypothetical protein